MSTFVPGPTITIPLADYEQLIALAESDDMFVECEVCGAWLHREDPATCSADDFIGCWKVATGRPKEAALCRSYRATVRELFKPHNVASIKAGAGGKPLVRGLYAIWLSVVS